MEPNNYEIKSQEILLDIEKTLAQKWMLKSMKISMGQGVDGFFGIIPLFIHVRILPSFQDENKVAVLVNLTTETHDNPRIQSDWIFERTEFYRFEGKRIATIILKNLSEKFPNFIKNSVNGDHEVITLSRPRFS